MNDVRDPGRNDILRALEKGARVDGVVRCVFSTAETLKVGTGTTTRKHIAKQYYFVEGLGDDKFSARLINEHFVPAGRSKWVTLKQLMKKYIPEIGFFEEKVAPAMEQLEEHLDQGDIHREDGEYYSAQGCYAKALGMDEQNMRALFSLGLVYLELEDATRARDMMEQILLVKTAFEGRNAHLYNAFGIKLRKAGLFEEAVRYYEHATSYVKNDENLYYNLARANYERGDWNSCVVALGQCYVINSELKESADLFRIVQKFHQQPELCEKAGKPPVPTAAIQQVREIYRKGSQWRPETVEVPEGLEIGRKVHEIERGRARSGGAKAERDSTGVGPLNFDLD